MTFVWLLSCVCHHVSLQMTTIGGGIVTHLTYVRFLATVCPHVILQIAHAKAGKVTPITLVGFFSTMHLYISKAFYNKRYSYIHYIYEASHRCVPSCESSVHVQ